MDTLKLRMPPELYVRWPEGGGFQQVEMLINDEPLIEIVRRVELPHALREFDERVAEGTPAEDLGERGWLAGNYHYLPPVLVLPPSRNFFGAACPHGFRTDADDRNNGKSLILGCPCGVTECWFLLARITVGETTVTWADFQQFHRDWTYDMGPFVFDRREYEAAFEEAGRGEAAGGMVV